MPSTYVGIEAQRLAWKIFSFHRRINCRATCWGNSKTVQAGRNYGWFSHHSVYFSIKIIKMNLHWQVCRYWGELRAMQSNMLKFKLNIFFDYLDIPWDRPASKTQYKRNLFLSYLLKITYTFSEPIVSTLIIAGWKCWKARRKRKILKILAPHINKIRNFINKVNA